MTIELLISQSFKNQQIIIKNKFYLYGHKRCKQQLHNFFSLSISIISQISQTKF